MYNEFVNSVEQGLLNLVDMEEKMKLLFDDAKASILIGFIKPSEEYSYEVLVSAMKKYVEAKGKSQRRVTKYKELNSLREFNEFMLYSSYFEKKNRIVTFKRLAYKTELNDREKQQLRDLIVGFFYRSVPFYKILNVANTVKVTRDGIEYIDKVAPYIKESDYDTIRNIDIVGSNIIKIADIMQNKFMFEMYLYSKSYVCLENIYKGSGKEFDNRILTEYLMDGEDKTSYLIPFEHEHIFFKVPIIDGYNRFKEMLKRIGIQKEFFKLPYLKQIARSSKILKGRVSYVKFDEPLTVIDGSKLKGKEKEAYDTIVTEGVVFISSKVQAKYKLAGFKASVTMKSFFMEQNILNYDIIIPADENKLNMNLDFYSKGMWISSKSASDYNEGYDDTKKNPLSFWTNLNIKALGDVDMEKFNEFKLSMETGKFTDKFIEDNFSYTTVNENGIAVRELSTVGEKLKRDYIDELTLKNVDEKLYDYLYDSVCGKPFTKLIALAQDMRHIIFEDSNNLQKKEVIINRAPNNILIRTEIYYNVNTNVVYVEFAEFWKKICGGDFDGDLITIFPKDEEFIGYGKIYDWSDKNDRQLLKTYIQPSPTKVTGKIVKAKAINNMLDNPKNIGMAFRLSMIIRELVELMYGVEKASLITIYTASTLVQRAIDAIKHSDIFKLPTLEEALDDIFENLGKIDNDFNRLNFYSNLDTLRKNDTYYNSVIPNYLNTVSSYLTYKKFSINRVITNLTRSAGTDHFKRWDINIPFKDGEETTKVAFTIKPDESTYLMKAVSKIEEAMKEYSFNLSLSKYKEASNNFMVYTSSIVRDEEIYDGFERTYLYMPIKVYINRKLVNVIKRVEYLYKLNGDEVIIKITNNRSSLLSALSSHMLKTLEELEPKLTGKNTLMYGLLNQSGDIITDNKYKDICEYVIVKVQK